MIDRSHPPESHPLENLNIDFPEVLTMGNSRVMAIHEGINPIIIFELILGQGKSSEIRGGESYYLAKMLMEGTKEKNSEAINEAFEVRGSFYEIASSLEYTSVRLYALKKNFKESLQILQEVILKPLFSSDSFEVQKKIRVSQIHQRLAKPSQLASLKFNELCFGSSHPLGRIITPELASNVTLEDVQDFYKTKFFSNIKVAVSGDFDEIVLSQIEELITALPEIESEPLNPLGRPEFGEHSGGTGGNSQSSIRLGGLAPKMVSTDYNLLRFSNTILGGYFGSRLMKKVREELGLTYGIHSTIMELGDLSLWMISAELNSEKIELATEAIEKEIIRLSENLPETAELEKVKNYLRGKVMMDLNSIYGRTNAFKSVFLKDLSWDYIDKYLQTVDEIESDQVPKMINTYFRAPERISLVVS